MEAAGVQANVQTYGTIIYSLLRGANPNMDTVQAIMQRMAVQKIQPSAYIYTILITHHFAQEEPNMEAIQFILAQVELSDTPVDHIFWDRVIEGFSQLGETTTAMNIFKKVDRLGSRVGYYTLERLIEALARNRDVDLAKEIVQNVLRERGPPPARDQRGVDGQHNFWQAAQSLALLDRISTVADSEV